MLKLFLETYSVSIGDDDWVKFINKNADTFINSVTTDLKCSYDDLIL